VLVPAARIIESGQFIYRLGSCASCPYPKQESIALVVLDENKPALVGCTTGSARAIFDTGAGAEQKDETGFDKAGKYDWWII